MHLRMASQTDPSSSTRHLSSCRPAVIMQSTHSRSIMNQGNERHKPLVHVFGRDVEGHNMGVERERERSPFLSVFDKCASLHILEYSMPDIGSFLA